MIQSRVTLTYPTNHRLSEQPTRILLGQATSLEQQRNKVAAAIHHTPLLLSHAMKLMSLRHTLVLAQAMVADNEVFSFCASDPQNNTARDELQHSYQQITRHTTPNINKHMQPEASLMPAHMLDSQDTTQPTVFMHHHQVCHVLLVGDSSGYLKLLMLSCAHPHCSWFAASAPIQPLRLALLLLLLDALAGPYR